MTSTLAAPALYVWLDQLEDLKPHTVYPGQALPFHIRTADIHGSVERGYTSNIQRHLLLELFADSQLF